MTPPKDPQNPRHKSPNSSRPAMDMGDKMLENEIVANGDGRFRYKDYEGKRQTDLSIAKRAGCNVSFISRQRRVKFGKLVPQQSEETRASKRGKPFGTPYQKKVTPQFVYPGAGSTPEPKPTPEINTAPDPVNIGNTGDLRRVTERLSRIEQQNRDILMYLKVLYTAWKPVDAPDDILDLLVESLLPRGRAAT